MLWQQLSTLRREGYCKDSLPAKSVSCRDGDLTSGYKMAQIGRFRAIWFRVIIVTGVHASKTSRARTKEASIRGLPLASGLVLGVATRAGRSLFFGLIASSVDPASSFLKRHNPPTPRSRT
jgi:hypothetical protein